MRVSQPMVLSAYRFGDHVVNGASPNDINKMDGYEAAHVSFNGGMVELHNMLDYFADVPTGTKIRVTMEVMDENERL